MYSTTVYVYQQRARVIMLDSSGQYFTMRYEPVYAKKLTINKGVDNVLLFEFINQDEKPVNITGSTLTFRLLSQNGDKMLLQKPMSIINAQYGRATVTIPAEDLPTILAQPASYSITRASGVLDEAVFVDANAGARADIDVVDSVKPQFVPSSPLILPTTKVVAQSSYDGADPGQWPDWSLQSSGYTPSNWSPYTSTEFYSSEIVPRGPVTTIQLTLVGYTGTIKVEAAENYQSIWYNVTETTNYLNHTGTIYLNVIGWHPLLRVAFNNSLYSSYDQPTSPASATATVVDGVITGISITNGGQGYLAPPKISIIGLGSGAIAEATVNGGVVDTITVVDGGSGYRPSPPQMTPAFVAISTGYVVDMIYR